MLCYLCFGKKGALTLSAPPPQKRINPAHQQQNVHPVVEALPIVPHQNTVYKLTLFHNWLIPMCKSKVHRIEQPRTSKVYNRNWYHQYVNLIFQNITSRFSWTTHNWHNRIIQFFDICCDTCACFNFQNMYGPQTQINQTSTNLETTGKHQDHDCSSWRWFGPWPTPKGGHLLEFVEFTEKHGCWHLRRELLSCTDYAKHVATNYSKWSLTIKKATRGTTLTV